MKKGLFIINPSSGKQNFLNKIRDIIGKLIMDQTCNRIDVFYTKGKNDALEKAASLEAGEYDFVVSVGGDGTLNEVINGMVIGDSRIPVAIISAGTVNDFASSLSLPQGPKSFCRMLRNFHTQVVDVGAVNNKYFINVVAAGFMSDIGFKVTKDKKALMGKLAYYLEGAADIPKQVGNAFRMRFITKEKIIEEEIMLFMVTNSKSVGGFNVIAPRASVSDGLLDVVIIRKMELYQMIPLAISLLQGVHVNSPSVEYLQTDKIRIELLSKEKIMVDYDGEYLEDDFPLDIRLSTHGVSLLMPSKKK